MIPHQNQAIEMSDIFLAKEGVEAEVTALAQQIKAAQGPEVAQMTGWLVGWGEDPNSGGMHHSDDGMMNDAEMDALKNATGAEASELFLDGMMRRHTGAISMARTELNQASESGSEKARGADHRCAGDRDRCDETARWPMTSASLHATSAGSTCRATHQHSGGSALTPFRVKCTHAGRPAAGGPTSWTLGVGP